MASMVPPPFLTRLQHARSGASAFMTTNRPCPPSRTMADPKVDHFPQKMKGVTGEEQMVDYPMLMPPLPLASSAPLPPIPRPSVLAAEPLFEIFNPKGDLYLSENIPNCVDLFRTWREFENAKPKGHWMASWSETSQIERIRLDALSSIFRYAVKEDLLQPTVHLAATYVSILCTLYSTDIGRYGEAIMASSVLAALRMAVKMEEHYLQQDKWRRDGREGTKPYICRQAAFCEGRFDCTVSQLNKMELHHLDMLENSGYTPVCLDYVEIYLLVGGWPEHTHRYRDLARFLLALSLFTSGGVFIGTPPSKMAAAAVMLAVKIVNQQGTAYEFWTDKLEHLTTYDKEELRPTVGLLGKALRRRRPKVVNELLSALFPEWAVFNWM